MSTSLGRRALSMATGTAVSRATGLLRVLVLAWVLGFTPLADAFNLANTIPNMLFDLVVGGVLSATFIPVVVERLAIDSERRAWRSISSVVTVALVILVGASIVSFAFAPVIVDGFTFLSHASTPLARRALATQRSDTVTLLRWFTPQIFFYGAFGLATALLNIRQKFAVGAWAPVLNNVVCIAVLLWFHGVDPSPLAAARHPGNHLVALALGTSAGVLVQLLALGPSLWRSDLGRLRFRWNLRDPAVKTMGRLGSWTLLVVLTNQASLYVVLAFAFASGGRGPVSAYTYGWSFMQMPYAVVVVSVMGALTPRMAHLASTGDRPGLRDALTTGLRQSLVIILPCASALIFLSQPIVGILLNHDSARQPLLAGTALAILAAGLPGFTIFQLCVRGLQSMQRARDVFYLYVGENALTILLAVEWGHHSLAGLVAAVAVAYAVAAVAGVVVLYTHDVSLVGGFTSGPVGRSALGALLMGLTMAVIYAIPTATSGGGLIVRTFVALVGGGAIYLGHFVVRQRRVTSSRRPPRDREEIM